MARKSAAKPAAKPAGKPAAAPVKPKVAPQALIPSDFDIRRELTVAGWGVSVRVLENTTTHKLVVEKQWPNEEDDASAAQRFLREAELLQTYEHPRVVPLVGVFMPSDEWRYGSLLLEFADRGSLREALPKLTVLQIYQVLLDVVEGLKFLHGKNMVHGNLKPENILVDKDLRAMLVDFGAPRSAAPGASLSVAPRTQMYSAPELGVAGGTPTPSSDVFSLGLIIYEAAVYVQTATERVHKLPEPSAQMQLLDGQSVDLGNCRNEALKAVIQGCLVLKPAERADLAKVGGQLEELLAPLATGAVQQPPPVPPAKPAGKPGAKPAAKQGGRSARPK